MRQPLKNNNINNHDYMYNFFKSKKLSLYDKRFYCKKLEVLKNPSLEELDSAYLVTSLEASEINLNKCIGYIQAGEYEEFFKLHDQLPYIQDEMGEILNCNLFEIYILKNKVGKLYVAIIFTELINTFKVELKHIAQIKSTVSLKYYLRKAELIYPIK